MSLHNLKGLLCAIAFVIVCAVVIAVITAPKAVVQMRSIIPVRPTRDGLTPETAIAGTEAIQDNDPVPSTRKALTSADLVWLSSLPVGTRCYLSLRIPDVKYSFVTVPEDWCKGMR